MAHHCCISGQVTALPWLRYHQSYIWHPNASKGRTLVQLERRFRQKKVLCLQVRLVRDLPEPHTQLPRPRVFGIASPLQPVLEGSVSDSPYRPAQATIPAVYDTSRTPPRTSRPVANRATERSAQLSGPPPKMGRRDRTGGQ